jgi:hypothetical protein
MSRNPLGPTWAPVLAQWRFLHDQSSEAGTATYLWSDGTETEERCASRAEAVSKILMIQNNGGLKPK